MPQVAQFDVMHNEAFRALGALAPGQQWSAFDVPRERAKAGEASIFVTTIWNRHSVRDANGRRIPKEVAIAQDVVDGTFWYRIARPGELARKTWIAHWNGVELALAQGTPIVGVLKDVASGKCAIDQVFDCPNALHEPGRVALWLRLVPRADIRFEVLPLDLAQITGQARTQPNLDDVRADFETRVQEALQRTGDERRARLDAAPLFPRRVSVTTSVFARSADVVAEVLLRANGHCETCGRPAPFIRKADGTAYLEVHHVVQLANGGTDTVENTIAVCPNCHRGAHFGMPGSIAR